MALNNRGMLHSLRDGSLPPLGVSFGYSYLRAQIFGVAPCPITIFTLGMLLLATKSVPWYLVVIHLLWSIVDMSSAVNLGVLQDYMFVVAGVLGTVLIMIQNRKAKKVVQQSAPADR